MVLNGCWGKPQMEWPALSPDLNPIENLWDQLSCCGEGRHPAPQNLNDLRATISQLVNSMRRRCQAVIDAQGHMTSYFSYINIFCCGIPTTVISFCFNKLFAKKKLPFYAFT
uniref:Tc1-like transposase DDE domain-containing protein n=1 Tax=Dicentrarchus labrax TaxID=13489 RepID=A0A8C4IUI6_DICLA